MRVALHAPPRGTPVSVDWLAGHIFETQADLFIAPEYFVQDIAPARWDGQVELAPVPKSRRDDFVGSLCEKTRELDTLIIPGSIMWYDGTQCCYNSAATTALPSCIRGASSQSGSRRIRQDPTTS